MGVVAPERERTRPQPPPEPPAPRGRRRVPWGLIAFAGVALLIWAAPGLIGGLLPDFPNPFAAGREFRAGNGADGGGSVDLPKGGNTVLAGRLIAEGADVVVWDPVASSDGLHGVEQVSSVDRAADGADAVVLVTEWPELADLDWGAIATTMRRPVFVDGRNMLDPETMRAAGFRYDAIGRATTAGA